MRFRPMRMGLACCFWLVAAGFSFAQTTIEEHWSPYDYPKEIPAGVNYHIIVDGDTLWDLAQRFLSDPLLWPQIYQSNAYIQDPDLIYPGDPLILDVGVVVDPTTIAESIQDDGGIGGSDPGSSGDGTTDDFDELQDFSEQGEGLQGQAQEGEELSNVSEITSFDSDSSEFVILPAGNRSDMECSTYIYGLSSAKETLPFDFLVSGGENKVLTTFGVGDIVYLNKGLDDGVQAGQRYSARRQLKNVYGPGNKKSRQLYGVAVDQVGIVKILAVQAGNATGMIDVSCFEVRVGDFLIPYEQEPIPLITELPVVDRFQEFTKEGSGTVIYSEDGLASFGKGHVANINLGIDSNVAPGDLFILYRSNPANNKRRKMNLPDIYLGHGVALKTNAMSTVIKVIEAHTELSVGDRVVPFSSSSFTP